MGTVSPSAILNPVLSVIIPAHNEELLLGRTLQALAASAAGVGEPREIIVVDDDSTDRTAEIARMHGARVVSVRLRHIGAARNAGAREARGDVLVFVDADTLVPPSTLRAALAAVRHGAVGGGAMPVMDSAPCWAAGTVAIVVWILRTARWAAGCFVFARREAFERVGGFDERYFASEEIHLSRALKKQGRFVILEERVTTSARKAHQFSALQTIGLFLRALWPGTLKRRDRLPFWYDSRRRDER
jgi:glycosyltransferase involved in cell wall biosynthesis